MKIAFYHHVWPHLFEKENEKFENKISEYLVIYNLSRALEKKGIKITYFSKKTLIPYEKNKKTIQSDYFVKFLFSFLRNSPDILILTSKSLFSSKKLAPLLRYICRIRGIKFLIFLGHDESSTSTAILRDVKPYKYKEDIFWSNPKKIKEILKKNEIYKPKSKNEFVIIPSSIIKKNCLKEGWPEKQIMILPHGIDYKYFRSGPKIKNSKKIKILFVGNGATRKGLSYLLKAFEKLKLKYPVELSIVSHGIKNIEIKRVALYKNITDNKLNNLYQTHDIFVLPSLLDGWGLTAMEAMANGLPVIISTKTGIVDIVKDKKNGLLISPKNKAEIYEKIKFLIENKMQRKIIIKNAEKTIRYYNWNNIADKFINFFR